MDYVKTATKYAEDVVAGHIPACKWVQLACERQLKDLKKDWAFEFNHDAANRICKVMELLPHIEGRWKTPTITLEPWQCFNLTTTFGWLTKDTGFRRFKTSYCEVPRKQGKSTWSAGVGIYMVALDDEPGSQVYSAAVTRDQAKIVWSKAREMIRRSPDLRKQTGLDFNVQSIFVTENAAWFRPLSSDYGTLEGLDVHCGIIDELHAHKNRKVFDVIDSGTVSRRQPYIWIITTAGSDRAGVCYEQHKYVKKILEGVHEDDSYFGIIYTIDDEDDWTDPEVHRKANPNYGISVNPEDLARKCKRAMEMASAQNQFLTKHLNVWVNADTAWMDMLAWDRCADLTLSENDFEGEPVIICLDFASKIDIAAKVKIFDKVIDGDVHVYAFGTYYVPEARVEQVDYYSGWVREGRLIATPGEIIDFAYIEEDLKRDRSTFQIDEVPYDPFQATQFSTRMLHEGFPMVEVAPNVKNFSEPMKELEALVYDGRFHFNGDPILSWMVSNVVCHRDAKDNIYPRKEELENKIDGIVATIMGVNRLMYRLGPSIYQEEELMFL